MRGLLAGGNGQFCIFDFCEMWKMVISGEILNSVMVEICVLCKNAQHVCADCYQGKYTNQRVEMPGVDV